MGLLDFIISRHADDYITIGFVIFLVVVGLYLAGFDVSKAIGTFQDLGKWILAFGAGAAGVYVLYHSQETRTATDDLLGLVVGVGLLSFAGYLAFGGAITGFFESASGFAKNILPYMVAGSLVLAGAKIAQSRNKSAEMVGIVMVIAGIIALAIGLGWITI